MNYKFWTGTIAGLLLGIILLSASIGKLIGQSAFIISVENLNIYPDVINNLIFNFLPPAELILGLLLLTGIIPKVSSLLACILVACFIFQNSWLIFHGQGMDPCSCLGAIQVLLQGVISTNIALFIDLGMLALALAVFFCYEGKLMEWRPWFSRINYRSNSLTVNHTR
jgi:hypothetical protein